jgi:hypothetical protein|tara:strand:+ start:319 stop:597 length:279 start_codon:yes stop_codon:yes gene_type:complete
MSKGDKDRTTNKKAYDDNYDLIFGKNQKVKQLQVTDLNWDGDLGTEEDTHTAEDYYKNLEVVTLPKKHLIARMMEKLNKKYPATLKSLKDKS